MTQTESIGYVNNAFSIDSITNNNNSVDNTTKIHEQSFESSHQAISIKNVCLSYGEQKILKGININVTTGAIYSLLGPSGCGKTSLLRCVVGVNKYSDGEILVFGYKPGEARSGIPGTRVGYMPQEIALFSSFSIVETLRYFGKLFHMKPNKIKERTAELINLLDLPNENKSIKYLSGGQLRRVSLSVALIHSPPLLILDEPTVGVDPMLRNIIWQHLDMLSRQLGTTIVITTQYIEEAKAADIVSFMRDGKILMEKNPNQVLREMNLSTLESAFLKLCQLDSSASKMIEESVDNTNKENCDKSMDTYASKTELTRFPAKKTRFACFGRISSLCWKYWTGISRNLSMLAMNYLMPSMQCLLNFVCIGPNPFDLPVAVYNADSNPIFSVSSMYLNSINNNTLILKSYETLDKAVQQVEDGLAWAAITFAPNFSQQVQYYESYDDSGDSLPQIGLYLDATNYAIRNTIQAELLMAYNKTVTTLEQIFNESANINHNPISIERFVYGNDKLELKVFTSPALVTTSIFFCSVTITALTLILERKDGIFERTLVAGVRKVEIIISQVLTQLIVVMGQVVLSLVTMFYMLDEFQFSVTTFSYVAIILLAQSFTGMALGLFVSAYSRNETQAFTMTMFLLLPILTISGVFWPVEAIPRALKPLAKYNSQTKSINAIRFVLSRGWDFTYREVQLGVIVPIVWFIVFIVLSIMGFK